MAFTMAVLSLSVVGYDQSEAASEETVTVSTVAELKAVMASTASISGNVVTATPKNIVFANDIILTDDDFSNYYLVKYFSGSIDGNGHSLVYKNAFTGSFLIDSCVADVTVKNMDLVFEGSGFGLIFVAGLYNGDRYNGSINVTLENITLKSFISTVGNNTGAFIIHALNSDVTFRNCVNEANYFVLTYAGIFLGGYNLGTVSITFDGCINRGNVNGVNVYMFIGNDTNANSSNPLTVVVTESCRNEGTITGDKAGLFANFNSNNTTLNQLNDEYSSRTELVGNIVSLDKPTETVTYGENNIITINGGDSANDYVVFMMAYANYKIGGTLGIAITIPMDEDVYAGRFIDKETAEQKYGLDVSGSYITNEYTYPYKICNLDNGQKVYIFDLGTKSVDMTLDSNPNIKVNIFRDGIFKGQVTGPRFVQDITVENTTYVATFADNSDVSYTVLSGTTTVVSGSEFKFKVTPNVGYIVKEVLIDNEKIEANSDGVYSYSPTGNFTITTKVEQVRYNVTYNLLNSSVSDGVESVDMESSFRITVVPNDGYRIASVYVSMGGQSLVFTSGSVYIPSVTGNLTITAIAEVYEPEENTPTIPWEDEDEYIPFPPQVIEPVQETEDDNVTVVACAAAAAVAALMAVFLIVDRRR